MNLSSVRTITSDAFDNGAQASHLAVTNPTADVTYICKVKPTGQVASDTDVKLDVYGTNLYSLDHVHNLKSLKSWRLIKQPHWFKCFQVADTKNYNRGSSDK